MRAIEFPDGSGAGACLPPRDPAAQLAKYAHGDRPDLRESHQNILASGNRDLTYLPPKFAQISQKCQAFAPVDNGRFK